jgi:hypothetical protein
MIRVAPAHGDRKAQIMSDKPVASSQSTHAHLVQFGPSSGLYAADLGRRRGRNPSPTRKELQEGAMSGGVRRVGPNPLVDFCKRRQ